VSDAEKTKTFHLSTEGRHKFLFRIMFERSIADNSDV